MRFIETKFKGLYVIEPEPIQDARGKFCRIFCVNELKNIGFKKNIVQINHALTINKGAIRGMHYQYPPKAEIKIVKCISGKVFDVQIDLRHNSPTFLQWHGEILSNQNMRMVFIPEGFAHGFQTLVRNCELVYFHSEFYSPEYESGIRYNDPMINIKWPLEITTISESDQKIELLDNSFKGFDV
ncbi:MAG: dTDP-4-dehydrorhamnose 3,5-epimerase [Promethearchaeota archaeon]